MANQEEDLSATELVTSALCEELQLSGEKDRLKNMLLEDLRTHGWTEVMFKVAGKETATAMHQAETESVGSGASKSRQSLSAFQLAQRIAKTGHDNIPDSVRARLCQKLVVLAREFIEQGDYPCPNSNNADTDSRPQDKSQA